MAYTESTMLPLGTKAPYFRLPDMNNGGRVTGLDEITRDCRATVIMFLCNHCPYVLHVNPEINQIVREYGLFNVHFIGICSNDAEAYPDDAPEKMTRHAQDVGYMFPYLHDATQEVARAYDAACTPDFYVFDEELRLVYRGQMDDSRPKRNSIPPTGSDLRAALDSLIGGIPLTSVQRPSGGCNIKWRAEGK